MRLVNGRIASERLSTRLEGDPFDATPEAMQHDFELEVLRAEARAAAVRERSQSRRIAGYIERELERKLAVREPTPAVRAALEASLFHPADGVAVLGVSTAAGDGRDETECEREIDVATSHG